MSSVIAFREITNTSSSSSSSSISIESESKKESLRILLIHGLLGSGNDFEHFSHSLASSLSSIDYRIVLVDLRNHGNSADKKGLSPPHDLPNTARDLANLVKSLDWAWPDVVIGHSLGGKVALQYALSCAQGDYGDSAQLPKQLWVLDDVPGKFESKSQCEEIERAFLTLKTLPSSIPSQQWLLDHMMNLGFSKFISEWISSSLLKSGEHDILSFNIDGVTEMFKFARDTDSWPLLQQPPKGMEISIVRTENQLWWPADVVERLESLARRESNESIGKVSVHVVPHSGHWIYRDQPQTLLEIMTPRIASLVQPKPYHDENNNK